LTRKPHLSDQVIVLYVILNQDVSLLASNLYCLLNSECIKLYLSSQSSVLTAILNQGIHQRALSQYQQPISEKATTTRSFVTINAFSFVISINSLWSILPSFTLYRI